MKSLKVLMEDKNIRISFDEKTYVIAFKDCKKAEIWLSFFQAMSLRLKQENKISFRGKKPDEPLETKDFDQVPELSLNILK